MSLERRESKYKETDLLGGVVVVWLDFLEGKLHEVLRVERALLLDLLRYLLDGLIGAAIEINIGT